MKIVNKSKTQKTVKAETLKGGDCFLYDGEIYLAAAARLAYNIKNGKYLYCYDLDVTPIEGTFTYEVK